MRKILNKEAIERIAIVDKQEHEDIKWYKKLISPKWKFWEKSDPEGYYYIDWHNIIQHTEEQLKSGDWNESKVPLIIEDKKVYFRPYVKMIFFSGGIEYKYFQTYREANDWANVVVSAKIKYPLILIE